MPSTLFDAMKPKNDFNTQLEQFKRQFGAGANPQQIIQQMLQNGQISQQQLDSAYSQLQQMRSI